MTIDDLDATPPQKREEEVSMGIHDCSAIEPATSKEETSSAKS